MVHQECLYITAGDLLIVLICNEELLNDLNALVFEGDFAENI